jgi:hypothetical protein
MLFLDDIFKIIISYTILSLREVQLNRPCQFDLNRPCPGPECCECYLVGCYSDDCKNHLITMSAYCIDINPIISKFIGLKIRKNFISYLESPIFSENSWFRSDFDITYQWESEDFVYLKLISTAIVNPYHPRIRFQFVEGHEDYHHFISSMWFVLKK